MRSFFNTIFVFFFSLLTYPLFAAKAPTINCVGLPGCKDLNLKSPSSANVSGDFANDVIGKAGIDIVITFIQYVAVVAVISLMLGGILYILSGGEEDKVKKAKSWIIWSLVGVFMSVSAWGIIRFITQLSINN